MGSVNVHLSKELQQFVEEQVEVGEFDGADHYIETLIARAKSGKERVEALLIEGLDSGDPIPLDSEEWSRIRDEVHGRLSDGK
jgi:antitoxin ParD1/3/4